MKDVRLRSKAQVVHLLQANSFCPLWKMTVYIAFSSSSVSKEYIISNYNGDAQKRMHTRCLKKLKQDKVEPIIPLHVRIQESDTRFFLFSTFWPYIHHIYSKYCNTYYFWLSGGRWYLMPHWPHACHHHSFFVSLLFYNFFFLDIFLLFSLSRFFFGS